MFSDPTTVVVFAAAFFAVAAVAVVWSVAAVAATARRSHPTARVLPTPTARPTRGANDPVDRAA